MKNSKPGSELSESDKLKSRLAALMQQWAIKQVEANRYGEAVQKLLDGIEIKMKGEEDAKSSAK